MRRRTQLILAAAVGAIVAALVGGIAWASIPDGNGVIQGCYTKVGGVLRVIDTAKDQKCTSLEVPISWNQQGPKGDKGDTGATGAPGKDGANGTNGTNGTDGVSVTTASEPSGANCAGGGVQLTAFSGVNYVCNGKAGADGKDGTNGTNGTNGADGVSVTSAVEPAGSNCAEGGSKFTAVNGVTYACNGTPGTGSDVLIANVNSDGTLAPGSDAVSSVKWAIGGYELTFARNTTNCAASVSAALGPGSVVAANGAPVGSVAVGLGAGMIVDVGFVSAVTSNAVDTAFRLIVAC